MPVNGGNAELHARGSRRIPAELWDASLQARRTLEAAACDARAMVEHARKEAESIRAQAVSRGREEGLASVSEIVARAALVRDRLLGDAEPQLVELAFAVARRVLERAVARDRDAVAELAALALESVRERRSVVLRVHPEDALALREAEPGLRDRLGRQRCIGLVEDPSVGRGGVVVETEAGAIDARLSVQLEALRRALAETPAVRTEGNGLPPCAAAPPAGEEPRPDGDGPAPDRPA